MSRNWINFFEGACIASFIFVTDIIKLLAEQFFLICWYSQELARKNTIIKSSFLIPIVHLSSFLCQSQQLNRIFNQLSFYLLVKRRISSKTWRMINLKQIWFALLIEHNIKSKNLKTHRILIIISLTLFKLVKKMRLSSNHCFNNHILDLHHQLLGVT